MQSSYKSQAIEPKLKTKLKQLSRLNSLRLFPFSPQYRYTTKLHWICYPWTANCSSCLGLVGGIPLHALGQNFSSGSWIVHVRTLSFSWSIKLLSRSQLERWSHYFRDGVEKWQLIQGWLYVTMLYYCCSYSQKWQFALSICRLLMALFKWLCEIQHLRHPTYWSGWTMLEMRSSTLSLWLHHRICSSCQLNVQSNRKQLSSVKLLLLLLLLYSNSEN